MPRGTRILETASNISKPPKGARSPAAQPIADRRELDRGLSNMTLRPVTRTSNVTPGMGATPPAPMKG